MAFFTITWFIWLKRNDIIFNGKVLDFKQFTDTFKFYLALWFKAKWSDCPNSILDVVRCPNVIKVLKSTKATKKVILWKSPPNFMKFNVDESARGKPGPASLGGVLRDENTVIKTVFFKSIGVIDSNVVELLVVGETLRIFTATR
ncbi:hypothetical protein CRYUN_Cryun07bG0094300 [Craigia yunnanensis]